MVPAKPESLASNTYIHSKRKIMRWKRCVIHSLCPAHEMLASILQPISHRHSPCVHQSSFCLIKKTRPVCNYRQSNVAASPHISSATFIGLFQNNASTQSRPRLSQSILNLLTSPRRGPSPLPAQSPPLTTSPLLRHIKLKSPLTASRAAPLSCTAAYFFYRALQQSGECKQTKLATA